MINIPDAAVQEFNRALTSSLRTGSGHDENVRKAIAAAVSIMAAQPGGLHIEVTKPTMADALLFVMEQAFYRNTGDDTDRPMRFALAACVELLISDCLGRPLDHLERRLKDVLREIQPPKGPTT